MESASEEVARKLAAEGRLAALGPVEFSQRAGYYLGEINAIHPFREGNGRTQREFMRQLAVRCGYRLLWTRITRQQMIEASVQSFQHGDNSGLATIILICLEP